jgi:hypothetical protein
LSETVREERYTLIMTHKTRSQIESVVFDATIGCGEEDERPTRSRLEKSFGRVFTEDEWAYARREWNNCLDRMSQR